MENKTLIFRKATKADYERIWQIIIQAKEQMRLAGSQQWQDGYPMQETIMHDIVSDYGYVLCQKDHIIAYGAAIFDGESAYNNIDGQWTDNEPYVVVHRLAVADEMKKQGIATLFMQMVEEMSLQNNIFRFRVDTNFDNYYMHKMLERLGFGYCGEIQYQRGFRMAFEKKLE